MIGGITMITIKSCELFLVIQMHSIAKGNNEKIKDLNEAFMQVY